MVDYDAFPLVLCKSSDKKAGSVQIVIGRRRQHELFVFSVLLVDLWKLGLKDAYGSTTLGEAAFNDAAKEF